MTSSKNTKRALFASVLSMLLCAAILIGSTFAWFTDTVSSNGNKIVAGNLKADLIHVGGEEGEDVSIKENPDHLIFDYDLWEPNYTVMETLKVVNNGNLAFKFRLDAVAAGATAGPNGEKLADVIDVYVYEGTGNPADTKSFADMTEANGWRNAGSLSALMADPDGIARGVLLPENATPKNDEPVGFVQMTVALHMQETTGNEYQGLSLGSLNFILNATQYTYEDDAFGDQYDKDVWLGGVDTAWYTSDPDATTYTLNTPDQLAGLSQLVNAGTTFSGKTITLNEDIDLNGFTWNPIGNKEQKIYFEGTFEGNNKTISGLHIEDGDYVALFGAVQDATIQNLTVKGTVGGENGAGVVARMESGIVKNCKSYVTVETVGKAGGIVCLTNNQDCTIEGCENYGTVNGTSAGATGGTGGIAAYANPNTKISGCHNYGDIGTAADKYVGGIVGYGATHSSSISNCTNNGAITGNTSTGGIIGITTREWVLTGCVNNGSVNGGDTASAGGIAGSVYSGKLESCKNTATVTGRYAGGVVGITQSTAEIVTCSGGTAAITSPAFTLGFTGHDFKLELQANDCAGRLIGANNGGGPNAWVKVTIDDNNGDDYSDIRAVGICGYTTTWANLEIVSGTFYGDPVAGNTTYIKINEGVTWGDRESGTYSRGGLTESRIDMWTKL